MKVEVKEKEVNGYEYPLLMKCEKYGIVVLFISDKCGTCIIDNSGDSEVGYFSERWDIDLFNKFHGEITLKND